MTITAHPSHSVLSARLKALGSKLEVPFESDLFPINPRYAKAADIVSGVGALQAAGRWNLPGTGRLSYTSLTPETAMAEALAHVRYYHLPTQQALPRVLVSLHLKAKRVLDLRLGVVRKALKLSEDTIRCSDWRKENQAGVEAITQAWGFALGQAGFEAIIVPSVADPGGANVLVYPANRLAGSQIKVETKVKWPA